MSWLLSDYWPWWFGSGVFALLTVGIWAIEGRFLGVSGSVGRVVDEESEEDREASALLSEDPSALDDALLEATLAEFGEEVVEALKADAAEAERARQRRPSPPKSVHLVLLAMIPVGGLLSALVSSSFDVVSDLGSAHTFFVADGALGLAILFAGGVLVGLGTRTAGGCSSGHGLSGAARLLPGSLVATACFFAAGAAVSFLLEALAR